LAGLASIELPATGNQHDLPLHWTDRRINNVVSRQKEKYAKVNLHYLV
jgi:hypothetical protein